MDADRRASIAWQITRQRLGRDPVDDDTIEVVPLAHGYRADVVQRIVNSELELGTPPRIVQRAILGLDAVTAITLRNACARVSTEEQDRRMADDLALAQPGRPVDRATFDRLAALVDDDPHAALVLLHDPATVLTADERRLLIDEARHMIASREESTNDEHRDPCNAGRDTT